MKGKAMTQVEIIWKIQKRKNMSGFPRYSSKRLSSPI